MSLTRPVAIIQGSIQNIEFAIENRSRQAGLRKNLPFAVSSLSSVSLRNACVFARFQAGPNRGAGFSIPSARLRGWSDQTPYRSRYEHF